MWLPLFLGCVFVRGSLSYSLFTVADIVTGLCVLCEVRDLEEETVFTIAAAYI